MAIELTRALPEHIESIARITFDAFAAISHRHSFELDIISPEMALAMAGAFVNRPDVYGVVALDGDTVVGHNFVQLTDATAGVGPICVDPHRQCKGVGRQLMRYIIEYAIEHHGPAVRLVQDSFNMASFSLYTSLGFDVTEPLVLMAVPPAQDEACRPLTPADVDAADALCVASQKVSRRAELLSMIANGPAMGCVPHGRFFGGRLAAFVVPGFFGFAAGETAEDMLTTAQVAVTALPPPLQRILLPTRSGPMIRKALARGFRAVKVLQLMAMGPCDPPTGYWAPSIAY